MPAADPEDMEALAAAEHESWSGWTRYMLEKIQEELATLSPELVFERVIGALPCVQRWKRQLATPYAELPEKERESDRIEARKKLEVYRPCPSCLSPSMPYGTCHSCGRKWGICKEAADNA